MEENKSVSTATNTVEQAQQPIELIQKERLINPDLHQAE